MMSAANQDQKQSSVSVRKSVIRPASPRANINVATPSNMPLSSEHPSARSRKHRDIMPASTPERQDTVRARSKPKETPLSEQSTVRTKRSAKSTLSAAHQQSTVRADKSQYNNGELGFNDKLSDQFIENLEVGGSLEKGGKLGISVSRSLLVLRIDPVSRWHQNNQVKICDYISHVNDQKMTKRATFADLFRRLERDGGSFVFKIKRPIFCTPTDNLPKGYDKVPGYKYYYGVLILYPGSSLGMNVKSYNGKVFVSSVEQNSVSETCCLIGDCVVAINDNPVTTTRDFTDRVTKALRQDKIAILVIERPVDPFTIQVVRLALMAEKTAHIDPRMANDATAIGADEVKRMQDNPDLNPGKSIYRDQQSHQHSSSKHVSMHSDIQENLTIGCDPCNPMFMQKAPPRPGPNASLRSKRSKRVKPVNDQFTPSGSTGNGTL